jgi:hypothetical protein
LGWPWSWHQPPLNLSCQLVDVGPVRLEPGGVPIVQLALAQWTPLVVGVAGEPRCASAAAADSALRRVSASEQLSLSGHARILAGGGVLVSLQARIVGRDTLASLKGLYFGCRRHLPRFCKKSGHFLDRISFTLFALRLCAVSFLRPANLRAACRRTRSRPKKAAPSDTSRPGRVRRRGGVSSLIPA